MEITRQAFRDQPGSRSWNRGRRRAGVTCRCREQPLEHREAGISQQGAAEHVSRVSMHPLQRLKERAHLGVPRRGGWPQKYIRPPLSAKARSSRARGHDEGHKRELPEPETRDFASRTRPGSGPVGAVKVKRGAEEKPGQKQSRRGKAK